MSEKWVVVEMESTNWADSDREPEEVHGIFDSKQAAEDWMYGYNYSAVRYYAKRIRKAVQDEWA